MRIDKERKFKFFVCINIILATIIGVYSQGITYYIVSDPLARTSLLSCLTILTVISIILFLTPLLLIYIGIKKAKISKRVFNKYLIADVLIGSLTSIWAVFVLIMCWG